MHSTTIRSRAKLALDELQGVVDQIDGHQFDELITALATARKIVLHGVGREGLMMRALAMRLHHLGCQAHVLGDMSTPPVFAGDLLLVSAGPGHFSSVAALADTAKSAGATIACITAAADGTIPGQSDLVLLLPAQTMLNDQSATGSVLPMGSLYEGAMYIVFELLVLSLREALNQSAESMRARHTNLE